MDLTTAITIGVILGCAVYFVIEFWELVSLDPDRLSKPVSGLESALGSNAIVSKDFSATSTGRLVGRVRFDGEDWSAEYLGCSKLVPEVGHSVVIREVDAARLTVKVDKLDPDPEP